MCAIFVPRHLVQLLQVLGLGLSRGVHSRRRQGGRAGLGWARGQVRQERLGRMHLHQWCMRRLTSLTAGSICSLKRNTHAIVPEARFRVTDGAGNLSCYEVTPLRAAPSAE